MADAKEIGRRIKRALRSAGKTEYDLAKTIGYSESTVHGYIIGKHMPDIHTFAEIAEVLGTTPNYLLGFSDIIKRKKEKEEWMI